MCCVLYNIVLLYSYHVLAAFIYSTNKITWICLIIITTFISTNIHITFSYVLILNNASVYHYFNSFFVKIVLLFYVIFFLSISVYIVFLNLVSFKIPNNCCIFVINIYFFFLTSNLIQLAVYFETQCIEETSAFILAL